MNLQERSAVYGMQPNLRTAAGCSPTIAWV